MMHPSDEELLERFVRGDTPSLGMLAERYEPSLVGLARSLLSGREDLARDAVQESWIKVIRHAKGFRQGSSFRTWMYRIVINKCHDIRPTAAACLEPAPMESLAAAHHDEPRSHELNGTLHAALEELPAGARLVLVLGYHRDLTHPQIADILGIPVGTVKSRLHSALSTLRARLGIAAGESGVGT